MKQGTIHKIPTDLREKLLADEKLQTIWDNLTPLARNEWICWMTVVKKEETRKKHIQRLETDLYAGKRRPCCWPGCPHHKNKSKSDI